MNARELIHALSAEQVDLDTELTLWAYDMEGTYRQWTVSDVTTAAKDGVHRTDLTIATVGPTTPVGRPIDTSGMTGDGGTDSWPTA